MGTWRAQSFDLNLNLALSYSADCVLLVLKFKFDDDSIGRQSLVSAVPAHRSIGPKQVSAQLTAVGTWTTAPFCPSLGAPLYALLATDALTLWATVQYTLRKRGKGKVARGERKTIE